MKRLLFALWLAAAPAWGQTTISTWQQLGPVIDKHTTRIRELEARIGMQQYDIAALRERDAAIISDLWLVIHNQNRTLAYAIAQLCRTNASIAPIQVVMPWFAAFPLGPHACPTEPAPLSMPYFIVAPQRP